MAASRVTARQCPLTPIGERRVTMVNLKTMATDGTAVLYIESGSCPVKLKDGEASFEEAKHHHQSYKFKLMTGENCGVEGWDNDETTMKCVKSGSDDRIKRKWEDSGYLPQACPPGCQAECKAIDPNWDENALKMFAFTWKDDTTVAAPASKPTVTRTVTMTSSSSTATSYSSMSAKSKAKVSTNSGGPKMKKMRRM